jgi:hypothetical protein
VITVQLWHGGAAGLRPGDLIVPSARKIIDGCAVCAAHAAGKTLTLDGHAIDPANAQPNRIYLTTDRAYAKFYASKWVYGDLYRVAPVGELAWSTEDPFPTWTAQSARVMVSVYERAVRLTDRERRRLLERWPDPGTDAWPREPAAGPGRP